MQSTALMLLLLAPADVNVEKLRDSVVLLVTTSPDGKSLGYGSGIVVNDDGLVLTNLHVVQNVASISALPYDPRAPSYAAIDGGLNRVLFEREHDLIESRLVRGDPTLDLALVQMAAVPSAAKPLPISAEVPRVGELVVAVGHPEQNLWSLTRGQVSAVHSGYIQHDAAVNKGSSGGPLVDAEGRVVGVNTSFVKGAQGIYYARPMSVTRKLVETVSAPFVLKRDNPRDAAVACARARELGLPEYSRCIDWGSHYEEFRRVLSEATSSKSPTYDAWMSGKGGPKDRARARLAEWLAGPGNAAGWVQKYGELVHTWNVTDDPVAVGRAADAMFAYLMDASRGGRPPKTPAKPAATRKMNASERRGEMREIVEDIDKIVKEKRRDEDACNKCGTAIADAIARGDSSELKFVVVADEEEAFKRWGIKVAASDLVATRALLRNGVRVDDVKLVGADRAWLAQSGRNFDGSVYKFSSYWSRWPDGGWQERMPNDDELRTRPREFPQPAMFGLGPAAMVEGISLVLMPVWLTLDKPDGIALDFDMEHRWPVLLELMAGRADVLKEHRNRLAALVDAQDAR